LASRVARAHPADTINVDNLSSNIVDNIVCKKAYTMTATRRNALDAAATAPAPGAQPASLVDAIRDAITSGDFVPNQRLVEAELSERFSAGRATIRAALVELAGEGLVERIQNRGARVRAITLGEAIEITEIRMVVEGLCAARAAERATDSDRRELRALGDQLKKAVAGGDVLRYSELNKQLHALIIQISGQQAAREVLGRLRGQNVRRQFRLAMHPGRPSVSLPQHLEIIKLICAGKPVAAESAMREHLRSVIDALPEVEAAQQSQLDSV
jgi:DNA-binding GntR family transcriptional regulator